MIFIPVKYFETFSTSTEFDKVDEVTDLKKQTLVNLATDGAITLQTSEVCPRGASSITEEKESDQN